MTPEKIAREIVMRVYETPDAQLAAIAAAIRTEREAREKAEAERDVERQSAQRLTEDLFAVGRAIGSVRFMDPPDGGDPTLAEQVARMREALEKAEAKAHDWQRAHINLEAQHREKQTFAHEQRIRAEKAEAEVARLREALERQCDNMAFLINHVELLGWYDKMRKELEEDRAALTQEPKP